MENNKNQQYFYSFDFSGSTIDKYMYGITTTEEIEKFSTLREFCANLIDTECDIYGINSQELDIKMRSLNKI